MLTKFTKAAGVAIGSGVLAAVPAASEAIVIFETDVLLNSGINNPPTGADVPLANTLDTIQGGVEFPDVDQFNFQGLTPGSFFDVFVELTDPFYEVDAQATGGSSLSLDFPILNGILTGIVPLDGKVSVILSTSSFNDFDDEGYRITLSTRASVPMPASIALVAAGLVGVGLLHVARRKRAA